MDKPSWSWNNTWLGGEGRDIGKRYRPCLPWLPVETFKFLRTFSTVVMVQIKNLVGRGKCCTLPKLTVHNRVSHKYHNLMVCNEPGSIFISHSQGCEIFWEILSHGIPHFMQWGSCGHWERNVNIALTWLLNWDVSTCHPSWVGNHVSMNGPPRARSNSWRNVWRNMEKFDVNKCSFFYVLLIFAG